MQTKGKWIGLGAVLLCLSGIGPVPAGSSATTAGARVVTAKPEANPRQAGASSVYFIDVAATDTHGSGKLMINLDQQKFVFNGKGFEPDKTHVLYCSTLSNEDPRVFVSAVVLPSGNLHVEGTWHQDLALPDEMGFVVGASSVFPGTIQRVAGAPCYTLTYADDYQQFTVYLPANDITYGQGGQALPSVFPEPVAVDYVKTYSSTILYFGYQGVYYSANWYSSCPYQAPIPTITGSYSPYRKWNDSVKSYDWYWNLDATATWDASRLPPGVLIQKIALTITAMNDYGEALVQVSQYEERFPGWDGIPAMEVGPPPFTCHDGYTWVGCYSPTLCPSSEWILGPPFIASFTVATTDGNAYTTSITLPPANP